jgi:hypothetical protein
MSLAETFGTPPEYARIWAKEAEYQGLRLFHSFPRPFSGRNDWNTANLRVRSK